MSTGSLRRVCLLVSHDVEHEAIGHVHTPRADGGEVVNATIHVVVDDAFDRCDIFVLHGQHGTHYRGAHSAGEFQGARWFGTIANHAREVGHQILY